MAYYWWEYEDHVRRQKKDRARHTGARVAKPPKRLLPPPPGQDEDENDDE